MNKKYLLDLANKHGSPLYVYDTEIIASQYKRITDAFEKVGQLQLNYAVKALSNINILRFFKNLGAGLDFVHHLNNFEKSDYSKEFMTLFTLNKVIIAGDASDELKAKAKAYGAELRPQIGGWIN